MRPSQRKPRFRTSEVALLRRDLRPFSRRRLLEMQRRLSNPDGHVRVLLPSGGWARVAPDASPELLGALDRMCQAALLLFTGPLQDQSTQGGGDSDDLSGEYDCGDQGRAAAGS